MATVQETISVAIGGVNAQTLTYTVPVDTSTGMGANAVSITYIATHSGTDMVSATMPSHAGVPVSNTVDVVVQPTSGSIALGPVTINTYGNPSAVRGWPGGLLTGAVGDGSGRVFPYINSAPGANSLVWNQVIQNYPISPYCAPNNVSSCGGGYKVLPQVVVNQTAGGGFSNTITIAGANAVVDNGSNHPGYLLDGVSNLIVATKGTYTFYINYADVSSYAFYMANGSQPGQTYTISNVSALSGGNAWQPYPSTSPLKGYKLVIADTNESAIAHPAVDSVYITFNAPGIYPIEVIYNQYYNIQFSGDNNGYFQITYLAGTQSQSAGNQGPGIGTQNYPVGLSIAPATGAAPTGDLRITPTGGAPNLVVQGQTVSLMLTVQNITYSSIPYMPILEGTSGYMTITNSGSNFNFQTYNGSPVDTTAAASSVFAVTGTNTSGLFNVTATGATPAPFRLNYTGGAFSFITTGTDIASTDLTIIADDIAWFDPSLPSTSAPAFDTFAASGGAGGTSFTIDVDFMVKPTVASVSVPSGGLIASGKPQAISINLSQPFSPQQQGLYGTGNTLNASASVSGAATGTLALTATKDGAGFLTGWTTTVTPALSTTNGTITLTMTVNGTLTYLSGASFVTNTVTYITGTVATITAKGNNYLPPTGVSIATLPNVSSFVASTAYTITGTEYTFENPSSCSMQFFYKFIIGGSQVNIGAIQTVPTASSTPTIGGKTAYQKSYAISYTFPTRAIAAGDQDTVQVNLGFTVTDNTSGYSTTYQSTTTYTLPYTIIIPPSCFTGNVCIKTPTGLASFDSFPRNETFEIQNEYGVYDAELVMHEFYQGWMLKLAEDKYVTLDHLLKDKFGVWRDAQDMYPNAERVWLEGSVYNLHVHAEDYEHQSYILETGDVAHNKLISCFTAGVEIKTPTGLMAFSEMPTDELFDIVNKTGVHKARLVVNEFYAGWMLVFADGEMVTLGHKFETAPDVWVRADEMYPELPRVWYEGSVYNMHVLSPDPKDWHYILANGDVAHNITAP